MVLVGKMPRLKVAVQSIPQIYENIDLDYEGRFMDGREWKTSRISLELSRCV